MELLSDFTRSLLTDPMEGPSWLFSDNERNNGQRQIKSRDEKRKEHSIKARLSSASKKLSLEPETVPEGEEETEVLRPETTADVQQEPEVEEPRRRGGARAAAQAARGSLKEPTLGK